MCAHKATIFLNSKFKIEVSSAGYKIRYNLQVVDVKRQIKSPILKRNFYIINVRKHDNFREILMNLICFSPITSANEKLF